MKVAVCLSGQLRSFKTCGQSIIDNIIEPLNADVFMHVWERSTKYDGTNRFKVFGDEGTTEEAVAMFKPIAYISKPFNLEKEVKLAQNNNLDVIMTRISNATSDQRCYNASKSYLYSLTNMFYKIYKANQLKCRHEEKMGFKYDYVIRCRPDFLFSTKMNIDMLKLATPTNIVLQLDAYAKKTRQNDKFSYGTSEVMDRYSNAYKHVVQYIDEGCKINGQDYNMYHIQKLALDVEWIELDGVCVRPK